ncbi:MAG: carbohydrate kinase [Candidatus Azobacteroides sp.]|nr:carbohydrate kinase [Candidatus Azobacteroides sp.]
MRKVIGIGETLLDIIFRSNQPEKAAPGGSTFNCMISLGRCNIPVLFISELGKDRVGRLLQNFMQENNLSVEYIDFFDEGNSPISLAFLDENRQAEYQFFRSFPKQRLQTAFPEINADDIVILGSYFAVNPELREKVYALIRYAKQQKAIVYYDINFRKAHALERNRLLPFFLENVAHASLVRCSSEDLESFFPGETDESVYREYIAPKCKNFIVTQGEGTIRLRTPVFEKNYPVEAVLPVSTIGAGDNFNAGIIYGLMKNGILSDDLTDLCEKQWDELIAEGQAFAKEACLSLENYISRDFARRKINHP